MDFFVTKNCVLTSARVAVKIPDPLKILSHKSSEVIQFNTVLELKLHLPLQIPNRDLNCEATMVAAASGRRRARASAWSLGLLGFEVSCESEPAPKAVSLSHVRDSVCEYMRHAWPERMLRTCRAP